MKEAKRLAKGDGMLMKIYNAADMFIRCNNEQLAVIDELYRKAESYDDGLNDGLSQGLSQGIRKVASNMLKSGYSTKEVVSVTGLSKKEIDTIKL